MEGVQVSPQFSIKHLGLMLDGQWSFGDLFAYASGKTRKMAAALGRLLPNFGNPREHGRRLYSCTPY